MLDSMQTVMPTQMWLSNDTFEEVKEELGGVCGSVSKSFECIGEECEDTLITKAILSQTMNSTFIRDCDMVINGLTETWVKCFIDNRAEFIEKCGGREQVEAIQQDINEAINIGMEVLGNFSIALDPSFLVKVNDMCGAMGDFLNCTADGILSLCPDEAREGIDALMAVIMQGARIDNKELRSKRSTGLAKCEYLETAVEDFMKELGYGVHDLYF